MSVSLFQKRILSLACAVEGVKTSFYMFEAIKMYKYFAFWTCLLYTTLLLHLPKTEGYGLWSCFALSSKNNGLPIDGSVAPALKKTNYLAYVRSAASLRGSKRVGYVVMSWDWVEQLHELARKYSREDGEILCGIVVL